VIISTLLYIQTSTFGDLNFAKDGDVNDDKPQVMVIRTKAF